MLRFDSLYQPYTSSRLPVIANKGMVATSQPLAAQAGLDMLKKGGNAIDAAIATAACLTVVEPTSNGIGGDAFALVWAEGKLHGLNGSGPAPASLSIEELKKRGLDHIPKYGLTPVTVPGAPGAWAALSKRFGKLPFKELFEPAISYAKEGYPISATLGRLWDQAYKTMKEHCTDEVYESWFETFCPDGRAPAIGETWKSQGHASTLSDIAKTKAESFYRGELADQIDAFSIQNGGFLRKEDMEAFYPEWVEPISANYRGFDVWEIPPNGQGLVALMALNILKGYTFTDRDTVDTLHKQIEAMKLASTDGQTYITDRNEMRRSVEGLLSEAYTTFRRDLIGKEARLPEPGEPQRGGTVYLATADEDGNMVSFIQSNYIGFGSGIVVPDTGIALQSRGLNFSMDPFHDNALKPGKRPYHTIIPGFLTRGEKAIGPFGVMGAFMQPQGHVQVIMNAIDFHLNPQAALDAPRWQWKHNLSVDVEQTMPPHLAAALARKGHDVRVERDSSTFGRGQIIWRDEASGTYTGGTESRTDGTIASW
ncbi:gamma-glutamyltransferase family protein [Pseudalkalibacillus hwajinpoensis]|uniref:gamma-glutamyltransferase family protein n=1 Tax=Guptibacillus hwajinpoensis TaxID=208199 RepID=UPI00325AD30F